MGNRMNLRSFTPLREAVGFGNDPSAAEVVLITEGKGNQTDRNYYAPEVVQMAAPVFNGAKCFLDHPTRSEEHERPERSVREQCGWFSDVQSTKREGKVSLVGRLNFMSTPQGREARATVADAIKYAKQFPNAESVLAGLSINAEGPTHEVMMEGEVWNHVDAIDKAISADVVTFPARGGEFLSLKEAEQVALGKPKQSGEPEKSGKPWESGKQPPGKSRQPGKPPEQPGKPKPPGEFQQARTADEVGKEEGGRIAIIDALKDKASKVEETHDPANVADLLQALEAFLGEEMREESQKEDAMNDDQALKDLEGVTSTAEADDFMAYDDESHAGSDEEKREARRRTAEQDTFSLYDQKDDEQGVPTMEGEGEPEDEFPPVEEAEGDPEDEESVMECEACGHKQEEAGRRRMRQAEEPIPVPLEDPAQIHAPAAMESRRQRRTGASLREAERRELVQLRAGARRRSLFEGARKAIRESRAVGLITPKELITFTRPQWPSVLKMAVNSAGPSAAFSPEIAPTPYAGPVGRKSAADLFEQVHGRTH